ncbi:MAG: hypothetical protein AAF311_13945 [Pseudomonadota bacterium]
MPPGFGIEHESVQYRITYDPDDTRWVQRLHYQKSLDDRFLYRLIGQTRETGTTEVKVDFAQAELWWRITPRGGLWESGLRFDARLRPDGRPEQLGANWGNQWSLGNGWRARLSGFSRLQVGRGSGNAVAMDVRAQLSRRLPDRWSVGAELYVPLGNTDDMRFFKGRGVLLGPFVSIPAGKKRSVRLQPLLGLTQDSRDVQLRLWVTQGF